MFGLCAVQARDLRLFLSREESQVWVAITDAVRLLGVTKVAVYKRYSSKNRKVKVLDTPGNAGIVVKRPGRPRYVNATGLADHLRQKLRTRDAR